MGHFPPGGDSEPPPGFVFHSLKPLTIPPAYQNVRPNHLSVSPVHLALQIVPMTVRIESLVDRIKPISMPSEHLAVPI